MITDLLEECVDRLEGLVRVVVKPVHLCRHCLARSVQLNKGVVGNEANLHISAVAASLQVIVNSEQLCKECHFYAKDFFPISFQTYLGNESRPTLAVHSLAL